MKSLVFLMSFLFLNTVSYASTLDNVVGSVALTISSVCIVIFIGVFIWALITGIKQMIGYESRKDNQIQIARKHLLPLYNSNKIFNLLKLFFVCWLV